MTNTVANAINVVALLWQLQNCDQTLIKHHLHTGNATKLSPQFRAVRLTPIPCLTVLTGMAGFWSSILWSFIILILFFSGSHSGHSPMCTQSMFRNWSTWMHPIQGKYYAFSATPFCLQVCDRSCVTRYLQLDLASCFAKMLKNSWAQFKNSWVCTVS